jgi:hypothetical protein
MLYREVSLVLTLFHRPRYSEYLFSRSYGKELHMM